MYNMLNVKADTKYYNYQQELLSKHKRSCLKKLLCIQR